MRCWLEAHPDGRAVAVDLNPPDAVVSAFFAPVSARLDVRVGDVRDAELWEDIARAVSVSHLVHGAAVTSINRMTLQAQDVGGAADMTGALPALDVNIMGRLQSQHYRLFGDETEFVYYAPGAVRIAEKASAPVKDRSHDIVTTIDLRGDEEGVIVAVGGMTGGFTMFIKDNRLYYDYNFLDGVYYTLESRPLPRGMTDIEFRFVKTGEFAGVGSLFVNGRQVDQAEMPKMHISTYSLAETFDIGRDTGTQVSRRYQDPFPFTGTLDRVVFRLTD